MASELGKSETAKVVDILKHILELELAGLVRYLHYSFMIFGHNRIPIVAWLRSQADESQAHAVRRRLRIRTVRWPTSRPAVAMKEVTINSMMAIPVNLTTGAQCMHPA